MLVVFHLSQKSDIIAAITNHCFSQIRTTLSTHWQQLFGWPFVKRFALCYRTIVCLSVLAVTLVYWGQTAGWIKMPLGKELDLGLGDIVLDREPAPLPQRDTAPIFGPCLLWRNGWMDQDATCYGGRPWPRHHFVRWGSSSPTERDTASPHFGQCLLWPTVAHLSYCWALVHHIGCSWLIYHYTWPHPSLLCWLLRDTLVLWCQNPKQHCTVC